MATGLRSLFSCIGVGGGNLSVLRDFYGFTRGRVPVDPDPSVIASLSLKQQFARLKAGHIHLNVIKVGFDLLSASDNAAAFEKLDYAIYRIRNIYRSQSVGIGRVQHFFISSADAGGRDDLGSEDEADALSDEWTVPGDGIDVFIVRNISDSDFVGISPIGGNCDKDGKDDGLVGGEINRDLEGFSRTFAHETGHFLGLSHNHGDDCPATTAGQNNLMAQTRCAITTRDSVLLTGSQGGTMRGHCSVRAAC